MKPDVFETRLTAILLTVIVVLLFLFLTGCYTEKKAGTQIIKAQTHYPDIVASLCGNMYPPLVYTQDSIIYKQGETIVLPGATVTVDCDSYLQTQQGKPLVKYLAVKCPDSKLRIDTFIQKKYTQVENKSKIAGLTAANSKLEAQSIKYKTYLKVSALLNMIFVAYLLIRIIAFAKRKAL